MAGEALATRAAAAELVIALSIAQRTNLVYGPTHEVATKAAERAAATLARALALEAPIHLRFSPQSVFLGTRNLGPDHPILKGFADRFWRRGVAGLTIRHDARQESLVALLQKLNDAARRRATREESERLLREAQTPGIEVHFLRQLLTHEVRDEVEALSPEEAQQQWEQLMASLESLTGPLRLRPGVLVSAAAESAPDAGAPSRALDYAAAVVDYLRHVEHDDAAVSRETEAGRRVAQLIGSIDSRLRRQLVTAAMKAPDLTPDSLEHFVGLVGHETLLETLRRLNESGQSVSPAAFRALSMLSLTQRETATAGTTAKGEAPAVADVFGDQLQELLEGMMADEGGDDYTNEEVAHLLQQAENVAERMALQKRLQRSDLSLSPEEGERHFLLVARELLRSAPDDGELVETVCRESQRSYLRLLDAGAARGWELAMEVAREAAAAGGRAQGDPWAWEEEIVLERLRQRLTEAGRWEAESSVDQLVAIGGVAVPLLVEVLTTSDSLAVRRRTLAGLESMTDSPAPQLLPLLDAAQPWYLQRNAVYLLRRRRDTAGAAAAKALWPQAQQRLRLEVLEYLLAVADDDAVSYVEEALASNDHEQTLTTARLVLKTPTREVVTAVMRRAELVAADLVGSEFHLALLRTLAATRHPQALHYVAELPARRLPVLPWQRQRFRREVAAMVNR